MPEEAETTSDTTPLISPADASGHTPDPIPNSAPPTDRPQSQSLQLPAYLANSAGFGDGGSRTGSVYSAEDGLYDNDTLAPVGTANLAPEYPSVSAVATAQSHHEYEDVDERVVPGEMLPVP